MRHGEWTVWKGSIRHRRSLECPLLDNPVEHLQIELTATGSSGKPSSTNTNTSTKSDLGDLDLETIAYVNYKSIPLWCIVSKVMSVYSDSEATCAFFQKLLDNNNEQMSIGLAIRCRKTNRDLLIYFAFDQQSRLPKPHAVWTNYKFNVDLLNVGKQLSALYSLHTNLKNSSTYASKTISSVASVITPHFLADNAANYDADKEHSSNQHRLEKLQELETLYQKKIRDIQVSRAKPTDKLDSHVRKRSVTPFDRAVKLSRSNSEIYRLQPRKNINSSRGVIKLEHERITSFGGGTSTGSSESLSLVFDSDPEVNRNYKLFKQIIMAAFRIRGISQESDGASASVEQDMLYAETFRSLVFAFRGQLKDRIPVEKIQEKTDKQLSVYLD